MFSTNLKGKDLSTFFVNILWNEWYNLLLLLKKIYYWKYKVDSLFISLKELQKLYSINLCFHIIQRMFVASYFRYPAQAKTFR